MKKKKFQQVYAHLSRDAATHQDSTGHIMSPHVTLREGTGGAVYDYEIHCPECDYTFIYHDQKKCRMCQLSGESNCTEIYLRGRQ